MRDAAVTRSSWPGLLLPAFEPDHIPPPGRIWAPREWRRIRMGALPPATDGRWFAYVASGRLHLHRAATGIGIYGAQFGRYPSGWRVVDLAVNSSPHEYRRGTDEYEALHFEAIVDTFLLRRNDPARWRRLRVMRASSSPSPDDP